MLTGVEGCDCASRGKETCLGGSSIIPFTISLGLNNIHVVGKSILCILRCPHPASESCYLFEPILLTSGYIERLGLSKIRALEECYIFLRFTPLGLCYCVFFQSFASCGLIIF